MGMDSQTLSNSVSQGVSEDVLRRISEGELRPGDRAPSIRQLAEKHDVTRYSATKKMQKLVSEGVLISQPQSGYDVAEEADDKVDVLLEETSSDRKSRDERPDNSSSSEMDLVPEHFYRPKRRTRTVTVYISELYQSTIKVWHDIVRRFESQHGKRVRVKMLSCRDGHLEDIAQEHEPEVVVAANELLVDDAMSDYVVPRGCGHEASDYVEPLARYCKAKKPLCGVPFSLTTRRVYVNRDWLGRQGEEPNRERARAITQRVLGAGEAMPGEIVLDTILSWLLFYGALELTDEKSIVHRDKAVRSLEIFRRCGGRILRYQHGYLSAMRDGRPAITLHDSYLNTFLQENSEVAWLPVDAPMRDEGRFRCKVLLLAIHRNAQGRNECQSLVNYLAQEKAQKRYGQHGANLPALQSAAVAPEVITARETTRDDLLDNLSHSFVQLPYGRLYDLVDALAPLEDEFQSSDLEITKAVERIENVVHDVMNGRKAENGVFTGER